MLLDRLLDNEINLISSHCNGVDLHGIEDLTNHSYSSKKFSALSSCFTNDEGHLISGANNLQDDTSVLD